MFRNNELLREGIQIMRQRDMERFAFLYLCGQRDRDLLAGKEKMTFQDFDRIIYITDTLGLGEMNIEIWNRFSAQFRRQFESLKKLTEENFRDRIFRECEDDIGLREKWLADFCDMAPDSEARRILRSIFGSLC